MQNLANFDAALKDDYTVGLRNSINNSNVVLAIVEKNDKDIVGRRAVWSSHVRRSSGTGSRAEGAVLPTAGNQGYEDPNEKLRYHYHTVKVSGQAIALTQNDTGAFLRSLDGEMKGAEKDLRNNISRQVIAGQGTVQSATPTVFRTGRLALLTNTGAVNDLVLDSATTRAELRFFFVGQIVDVITATTGAVLAEA